MTDIPNTPEPKPVSMRDLRESLAMIARPAGVPVSFGGLSVALDELERLRALDAPALAAAVEAAKATVADLESQLAREREGAGGVRSALEAIAAMEGEYAHADGCVLTEDCESRGEQGCPLHGAECPTCSCSLRAFEVAAAALSSDAGKAALEMRRDLAEQAEKWREQAKRFGDAVDALKKFKAYVHRRLDEAGISTHPNGPHSKEGCRVGDRLDIALVGSTSEERRALEAKVTELAALADLYATNANELSAQHRVERDALKAEVERLTCEQHAGWRHQTKRAEAAEAEVKRLRAALLNYLQAGHKEARERAAQQAKVALGIPLEHSGREPQYALAPSQPAPANPNIDPDTGRDHMPEPIRRPAPASPVVGVGMKVCGNCKKPIAGDEHARLEQDDSRIASVCWQSFHLGKCLEPSAPSPAGGEEGPAPAEAVDVDHRADFEERVKRHQVRCSHVEHGQRLCVGCAARAATEWLNRLLLPVNEGGSGALVSRADLDADVAKAVAEAWERAAQIVEGPMVPGSRVPTTEERGLAAIFRNRARSTSPAGGAL